MPHLSPSQIVSGHRHCESALQVGPRKKLCTSDPLVHHGQHFGQTAHAMCDIKTLVVNGTRRMEDLDPEFARMFCFSELREQHIFKMLLDIIPGLEEHIRASLEEEIGIIAELCTGALLCPAGLAWSNQQLKTSLKDGSLIIPGDQWPNFIYKDYKYDSDNPWIGAFQSSLLVSSYKYVFTSPSSVEKEPKATRSGNARIHGMSSVTPASIAYVATQVRFGLSLSLVFTKSDAITDSERFYSSILDLFNNIDEREEVEALLKWWNIQIFPSHSSAQCLVSKNSALARIKEKCAALKAARVESSEQ
ncbi:hypothetical protein SERLA73DRAFT_121668 [Serpula lacrymans var. lacrymans S7.3]|uniref:Uncharacterized protein n=2 Tax=Serpula lacrymans var. lacrymans TaxID=341189 RepID=F8PT12_SERL3|nr:uncharacterized protein SERLADRAFT_368512 [Serpula lacrymans var. lacrymans S7.9]EGO01387.1 hypothetical protein SERLA73DRAFT_121668 [Serpula lacrymans var. lacrymans S7.3]EGO27018.1 hypothetical protein SERLADRAFT_368512 [Serpula lacrymans var. lacrymans S7.9]